MTSIKLSYKANKRKAKRITDMLEAERFEAELERDAVKFKRRGWLSLGDGAYVKRIRAAQ